MNALQLDAVRLSEDRSCLEILDQTLLPGTVKTLRLDRLEDIREAICSLRVRGAPAIGVCAGYAVALGASQCTSDDPAALFRRFMEWKERLASSRPTAVNLFWALERMERALRTNLDKPVPEIQALLFQEAERIRDEDIAISRAIGELGFGLMRPGCGILTHCNAGTLATAKYGTATAPMYIAKEHGWSGFRVYCDETRPLLQGARLTAFELTSAGIDTTLICDDMAASVMRRGLIDLVFVGCDRVARNGDTANKIGTLGVAVLARYYKIPFYVCAPSTTIDLSLETGARIPIEERDPGEIAEQWYKERMAPADVRIWNPAFDVTDHSLITGILTEKGLALPPFSESFRQLGIGG